jgi:hypothetical protein
VLGKLGRHEQVLSMYVTVLHNVDRAIEYCDKVNKSKNEDSDQVKIVIHKRILFFTFIHEL